MECALGYIKSYLYEYFNEHWRLDLQIIVFAHYLAKLQYISKVGLKKEHCEIFYFSKNIAYYTYLAGVF